MIRKEMAQVRRKFAAVGIAVALTAGLLGCAKTAEEASGAGESSAAQSTVQEPINPEQVKSEEIIKEKESAVPEQAKKEPEPAVIEKPEPTVIEKPEPTVIEKPEPSQESAQEKAESVEEEEKEEESGQEKKEGKAAVDLGDVLDGVMSFDGMTLEFPIELSKMKLGKWTITYEIEGDPADKILKPKAVVLARMTSPDYTDNDVIVKAEFGNYTDSEAALSDLPMTGIYITKGKGTGGAEPKTPSLELPCGFTWGTSEDEIREQLGEASLSGSFEYEFDFMYENGKYLLELAGMRETGLEYVVYSVE